MEGKKTVVEPKIMWIRLEGRSPKEVDEIFDALLAGRAVERWYEKEEA